MSTSASTRRPSRTAGRAALGVLGAAAVVAAFWTLPAQAAAQPAGVVLAQTRTAAPVTTATPQPAAAARALELAPGPQLLIDDHLIAASQNVARVVNQPERFLPGPVVTSSSGHHNFQFLANVVYDDSHNPARFRMWYAAAFPGTGPDDPCAETVAYLESADGLNWPGPAQCLARFQAPHLLDDRQHAADEAEAYKLVYVSVMPEDVPGLRVAFSPDGLDWTPYPGDGPVLRSRLENDIWNPFYDPFNRRYGVLMKLWQAHTWTNAEGEALTQMLRLVGLSTSDDFRTWSQPEVVFAPDSGDPGLTQWYGGPSGLQQRGGLLFGMLKVLRDDLVVTGAPPDAYGYGYTVLAWSRDGMHWERDRHTAPFFEPDPTPGAWDHAHAWVDSVVPAGDEVYLYYGGYRWGHKQGTFEERQIGVARLARDRYVARAAGDVMGTLRTPLFVLSGSRLTLNVDAAGGLAQVRLLDDLGRPIPGFTYADCEPITADALDAPVRCTRMLDELRAMPVSLEFSLRNARLYAFELQ